MPDFKPKEPVKLDPPKDDPISLEELAKADGECRAPAQALQLLSCAQCHPSAEQRAGMGPGMGDTRKHR